MQVPRIVVSGEAKLVLIEPADQMDLALVPVMFPSLFSSSMMSFLANVQEKNETWVWLGRTFIECL